MNKRFYVTTPIYYVNDQPHLGHAYCTVIADILNRYHRFFGEETYFLTGTDEHGQKVEQAARTRSLDPQQHCDEMADRYISAWQELEIEYNQFFRTTASWHKSAVQRALQELYDRDEIYTASYEGWYCVSEEIFYTEKDLVDGQSPTGKAVERVSEKNYFFRMSRYQDRLIEHIQKNPEFIQPDFRRNEVLGFLRQPLQDLSISRPKTRLKWGIELPFDKDYVTYVWFDALLNYATAVGYGQDARKKEFAHWWESPEGGPIHLLGKDILTTHAVYWPTMLMALGLRLPRQIFATGWILNKEHGKMSKSEGSIVTPQELISLVGPSGLRYFLARDIHLGNDAPFTSELLVGRVNTELANNLGNLLSRTTQLIMKFFNGQAPEIGPLDSAAEELRDHAMRTPSIVRAEIENMSPSRALENIVQLLNAANRFLEDKAPWKLAKIDTQAAGTVLGCSLETLRIAATLLVPVMPSKMRDLIASIGQPPVTWQAVQSWGLIEPGTTITKGEPLFPRINTAPAVGRPE